MTDALPQLDSALVTLNADAAKLSPSIVALEEAIHLSDGILLVGGNMNASPSQMISWPITLLPGKFLPSAFQADIVPPPGFTIQSVVLGPVAIAANKQIGTNIVNGNMRFLIFGFNLTPVAEGVVAIAQIAVGAVATTPWSIGMINGNASTGAGQAIITSTISGTVTT